MALSVACIPLGIISQAIVLKFVEVCSSAFLSKLPRYEHIITATTYNSSLIKSQILKNPLRATLADRISELAMLKDSAATFVGRLTDDLLEPAPDAMASPEVPPVMLAADAALQMGSTPVASIAACNIIEEFGETARGRDMAAQLLRKGAAGLPESLNRRLQPPSQT